MSVHLAKTQISLGICPVWSESSLSTWRKLGSLATLWVHREDSGQTGRMPRLIWVFAGRTLILLVLSCRGSHYVLIKLFDLIWFDTMSFTIFYLILLLLSNDGYHMTSLLLNGVMSCHRNCMNTNYIWLGYWQIMSWCCPCQYYGFYWKYLKLLMQ